MENLKLRQKWREEAEERDNRDVWLNDNYEIRIKVLSCLSYWTFHFLELVVLKILLSSAGT